LNYLNLVTFLPNSWNLYESISKAYLKDDQKELAIENYKKSLELNSNNKNAEEILKRLRNNK
jgi:hypothetical protein